MFTFPWRLFAQTIPYTPSVNPAELTDSAKFVLRHAAEEMVTNPQKFFSDLIGDLLEFGLKVLCAIAIYIIGALLIKWVKRMMTRVFEKRKTEKTIVSFVTSLISIALTILLIVITISTLGINTTSIAALLAAGGMAIGMALSGTVQNLAGGLMILTFKPFKAGDFIKAQGFEGYVTDVNIVSTKIRTYDNTLVVLPNGSLFNGTISNVTHNRYHRVQWNVGVAYGADAAKVREVLLSILNADPRVLHTTQVSGIADPSVNLNAFKDSSVEFVVRCWVDVADYWKVQYDINERIYTELPRNGIAFPFPQVDVHMKKD